MSLLHPPKHAQIEPQIGFFSEAIEPFSLRQQFTVPPERVRGAGPV
jgi:hypothetical protein